jgi:uncharacterized membrane protein (DUF2068 family)
LITDDPRRVLARRPLGVRLIVSYKAIKAFVELVPLAMEGALVGLGRALAALVSERGVHLLELGLAVDGVVSGIEGWALWRGYRWGASLVVLETAMPLPLEVLDIARTHRASRIALALLNIAVVVYLTNQIRKRRSPRAQMQEVMQMPSSGS